jgi:DNA polymerase III alpha subunit
VAGVRIRTGYSFRAAVGLLPQAMARLVECKYPAAPITDRASTFGFVKWAKLAAKNNLRPCFGVELAVSADIHEKKNSTDYWTFLAIDDIAAVNKLVQLATSQFYYEAILNYEQASKAEGVIKVAGYRSDLTQFEPAENLYVSLAPSCSKGYIRDALNKGHQLAACSDNKWTSPTRDDQLLYETIIGRETSLQSYDQFLQTTDEWFASMKHKVDRSVAERAMANSLAILEQSTAQLRKSTLLTPEKPMTLRAMCEEGAKKLGCDLTDPVYAARLDRELALFAEKKFDDYIYIIADICQWSRARLLTGPARGSAAGSLSCYLLGITTIDSVRWGLIFERFVDVSRNDAPDIDIDFDPNHREEVLNYMCQKYGTDRVARIGSVALYKGSSSLNEAGAALRVPRWKCNAVSESLLKRSGGDARALDTLEDTFKSLPAGQDLLRDHPEMNIVTRMEGHPRHHSQHAAGVVITNEPAINYAAIDARTGTLMCDKKDAEDLNLLKIDCLGLTQLSTFAYALELAGLDRLALESIPLDDQGAFEILNEAKFCGIFQFNGMALQSIVKQFTVECFDDIVAITALARPGPLASGNAHEWVRRKNKVHEVTYPHDMFAPYLNDTLGIVLFQEQVMEISRNVGDLSWEDVSSLRKAMSKSLGKEYFDKFGDKWKAGAIAKGGEPEAMNKVWDALCSYGSWCLSGKTKLVNPHPNQYFSSQVITLKQLYDSGGIVPKSKCNRRQKLLSWVGAGLKPQPNIKVLYSGKKETWLVKTASGNNIRSTMQHAFMVHDFSFKQLSELSVGDSVMIKGSQQLTARKTKSGVGRGAHNRWPMERAGTPFLNGKRGNRAKVLKRDPICTRCHIKPTQEVHHKNFDHKDHRMSNLSGVCRKCHKKYHSEAGIVPVPYQKGKTVKPDEIVFIGDPKVEDVYDIEMPAPHHNFLANDFVVHNSFNKSHAVSYGIISYQCLWLKANFPFEFAAATLTNEADPDKQIMMLREMVQEGYDYIPIDTQKSTDKWTVGEVNGKRVLIGPFTNIKGVGAKTIDKILQARKDGRKLPAAVLKLVNESTNRLGSLFPIGDAFKRVLPNPDERGFKKPKRIKDIVILSQDYEVTVFCVLGKINPRDENEAVNVARRGGKVLVNEPTASLNLQLTDDTDTIFGKVSRWDYDRLAKEIVERGRTGKCLYVITGKVKGGSNSSFRMMKIESVTYVGDLVAVQEKKAESEEEQDEQLSMF